MGGFQSSFAGRRDGSDHELRVEDKELEKAVTS